jgi:hypothetical protein
MYRCSALLVALALVGQSGCQLMASNKIGKPWFAACAADAECQGGQCIAGSCTARCSAEHACPAGTACGSDGLCAPACEGSISVRIFKDTDGATKDIGVPYYYGLMDYLRNLNDAGGLRGCPIDMKDAETSYDDQKTINAYNAWKRDPSWSSVVAIFTWGTGPTASVADQAMADKKILISGSYAGSLASPIPISKDVSYNDISVDFGTAPLTEAKKSLGYPYLFFPSTDYSTGARVAVQTAWKEGGKKIAMFHGTALYCTDPLAAAKSQVNQLGPTRIQLGRDLIIEQTATPDENAIINAIVAYFQQEINEKKAMPDYVPVDWVWSGNTFATTIVMGKALEQARQLIRSQLGAAAWDIRLIANNWGINDSNGFFNSCGGTPNPCVEKVFGIFPFRTYGDVSASGMPTLMDTHDRYRMKDGVDLNSYRSTPYVQGYVAALMWRLAMEKAIADGNPVITPDILKTYLERFDLQDMQGLTAGRLTFTPNDHRGQSTETIQNITASGVFSFVDTYQLSLDPSWQGW